MLLSAVSVLVAAQSSSEIPKGLMNNPVFERRRVRAQGTKLIVLCFSAHISAVRSRVLNIINCNNISSCKQFGHPWFMFL